MGADRAFSQFVHSKGEGAERRFDPEGAGPREALMQAEKVKAHSAPEADR